MLASSSDSTAASVSGISSATISSTSDKTISSGTSVSLSTSTTSSLTAGSSERTTSSGIVSISGATSATTSTSSWTSGSGRTSGSVDVISSTAGSSTSLVSSATVSASESLISVIVSVGAATSATSVVVASSETSTTSFESSVFWTEPITAVPETAWSSCPERLVIFTIWLESFSISSNFAASGERRIATPSEGSNAPITKISTVFLVVRLVTPMLSPGKYPTVLAKTPWGISPSLATIALPSKEGLNDVKIKHPKINERNNPIFFFIILSPYPFMLVVFKILCNLAANSIAKLRTLSSVSAPIGLEIIFEASEITFPFFAEAIFQDTLLIYPSWTSSFNESDSLKYNIIWIKLSHEPSILALNPEFHNCTSFSLLLETTEGSLLTM